MHMLLNLFSIRFLVGQFTFYCGGGGGGNEIDPNIGKASLLNAEIGKEVWDEYKKTYLPKEREFVADAFDYDTPEQREKQAGLAQADVQKAVANQRGQTERNLASMGVDPTSGRFADATKKGEISSAVQEAGAANKARDQVEQLGYARKQDAISIGKGMPGQASTAISQSANSAAQNSQLKMQAAQNESQNTANAVGGAISLASTAADWFADGGEVHAAEQHLAMGGPARPAGPAGLQQIVDNGASIRAPVAPAQPNNTAQQAVKTGNQVRKIVNSPIVKDNVAEALNSTETGRSIRDAVGAKDWALERSQNLRLAEVDNSAYSYSHSLPGQGAEPAGLADAAGTPGVEVVTEGATTGAEAAGTAEAATAGTEAAAAGAEAAGAVEAAAAGTEAAAAAAAGTEAAAVGAAAAGTELAAAAPMAAMGPAGWVGLGAMALGSLLAKDGGKVSKGKCGKPEIRRASGGPVSTHPDFDSKPVLKALLGIDTPAAEPQPATATQTAPRSGDEALIQMLGLGKQAGTSTAAPATSAQPKGEEIWLAYLNGDLPNQNRAPASGATPKQTDDSAVYAADGGESSAGLSDVQRKDMTPGGAVRGPGTETSDSIPARLSDGEIVENAKAVQLAGSKTLLGINNAGKKARYGQMSDKEAGLEIAELMINRGRQLKRAAMQKGGK